VQQQKQKESGKTEKEKVLHKKLISNKKAAAKKM
jgi:hypothetical protein